MHIFFLVGIFGLNNLTLREKNSFTNSSALFSWNYACFQILPAANPTIWILTGAVLGCFTADTCQRLFLTHFTHSKGTGERDFHFSHPTPSYCSLTTISFEATAQKSSPLPHVKKSGNTFDSNQNKISCNGI